MIPQVLDVLIKQALQEDRSDDDVTTGSILDWDRPACARVLAKASGIVSGLDVFCRCFELTDEQVNVTCQVENGQAVESGRLLAKICGQQSSILRAERVALNFLQHLSGVATLTRRFVDALSGTGVRVLDTRKTTPLLRDLEKRAVLHGGGVNHRRDLAAMALIKENHIDMAGSITRAVHAVRTHHPKLRIEVEVKNLTELSEALSLRPDVIMLDNFSQQMAAKALLLKEAGVAYEISGNITLKNVKSRVLPGIDYVSIGALTHSAPVLDISLLTERM